MKRKILTVIGARPQFIKSATVSKQIALKKNSDINEVIAHTGQHYDDNMSDLFFRELAIPKPSYNLDVGSGSHAKQTGDIMLGLEKIVEIESPDLILVYGDTNTTLAGALVAAKSNCYLAHVEAGLRSYRKGMPEEINRVVTDSLSDLLFCPTISAKNKLISEGKGDNAVLVGDVMHDSFLHFAKELDVNKVLQSFGLEANNFILSTIHRAENTDDINILKNIISSLRVFLPEIKILFPLHPRTKKVVHENKISLEGFHIIEPISYKTMISFLIGSKLVVTDSGGVQKEAYFARTPCVTVRDETEWLETLSNGWNRLAPPSSSDCIISSIRDALNIDVNKTDYVEFYGDGNSASKIVFNIELFLKKFDGESK